jgi:branched-chain amino acid transport system permease protein
MVWLETVINGIFLGGLYGILGLGLALVFGVMRVINVAHGEFIVGAAILGSYITALVPGMSPLVALIPIIIIAFACGWLFQVVLLNKVVESKNMLVPMLVTFGVSIIMRNAMLAIFGSNPMAVNAGSLAKASIEIGGVHLGILPIITLAISILLFGCLQYLVKSTMYGRMIRATADNPEVMRLMGVNPKQVYALVMGLAFVMAAVAGVLLSMRTSFSATSGIDRILIAFEVVVLGGLGSFWGALIAGILLGVVQLLCFQFDANSGLLYAHLLFFGFLVIRPNGIMGART